MDRRVAERIKRRLTCELRVRDSRHAGIVLDISESGLFVQTAAKLPPHTLVDLRITGDARVGEIGLRAVVVRRFEIDSRLAALRPPGVGLAILEAPKSYYGYLVKAGVGGPPRRQSAGGGAPAKPAPEPQSARSFQVRVAQVSGTRSRVLQVDAADAENARQAALAKAGEGWEVREVTPD